MNVWDIVLTAVLVIAAAAALWSLIRSQKRGGSCSCGCEGCPGGCRKKNVRKPEEETAEDSQSLS